MAKSVTEIRFHIIVAMLNEDPKLYDKVRFYVSEKQIEKRKIPLDLHTLRIPNK